MSEDIWEVSAKIWEYRKSWKKQENLEDSLKELKKEKSILDVLSIDYTSIYTCDLLKDTMIPVKQEENTRSGNECTFNKTAECAGTDENDWNFM